MSKQKQRELDDDCYRTDIHSMFTKMSAKQVIKRFKDWAVAAIIKEYIKHHYMNTFSRLCPDDLTPEKNQDTLHAINLSKEKRCGKIKGRACPDGRAKIVYIKR